MNEILVFVLGTLLVLISFYLTLSLPIGLGYHTLFFIQMFLIGFFVIWVLKFVLSYV